MSDGKIHPPSEMRIAEARRAGVVPRPLLLGLVAALLVSAVYAGSYGAQLRYAFVTLMRAPLLALAQGQADTALSRACEALTVVAAHALLFSLSVWVVGVALMWLAQGVQLSLPRRSKRFAQARPSRTVPLLLALVLLVLSVAVVRDAFWLESDLLEPLLLRWFAHAAGGLVLLAVIDVSFARAAFFRALYMTRREQRDELREAYGSPEIRGARDRVRREQGQGA